MSNLERDLERAQRNRAPNKYLVFFFLACILSGVMGGIVYWTFSELPRVNDIEEYAPFESSKVYSSDGKVLAEYYYERRTFIPSYEIPDHVKKAFVAIEDARFYSHPGVDVIGILRAVFHDIKAGGMVQGGSTITQQLAKMLFLKPEKSLIRKMKEMVLSLQIEKRYTKDEILGLYLNQAYFGSRAFGIEAAAQTYFGKSVPELTVGDAALLASLPKAPSLYSPFRNPRKSRQRRAVVLREMLKQRYISPDQYERALREPVPASPHFRKYEAPYFVELLRRQLEYKYGSGIYTDGYKIYSTIDLRIQHAAEAALRAGVKNIEKRRRSGVQAALVAVDSHTGHIKAMIGGFDFWQNQFNRATQAMRQPGSAFKPFVYTTALENGLTPEAVIEDAPITLKGSRPGEYWSPRNYDGQYHGDVTLETALAESLNVATVRLAVNLGVRNIIETARRIGIRSELTPYPSLALGASDVTLLEMVGAYSVFATGKKMDLAPFERIENRDGLVIEENYPVFTKVLSEDVVSEMREMLGAVVRRGTAVRAKTLGVPVFGKTGTTNDYTDAWFVGFDDNLVVGVWVGRDDHKPIGYKETGSAAALPIWIEFMKQVLPLETHAPG